MTRRLSAYGASIILVVCFLSVWANPLDYGVAFGREDSGLTLTLSIEQSDPPTDVPKFKLNDPENPVTINMMVQNTSKWPIHTLRDFPQIELPQSIIVTGPDGQKYSPNPNTTSADMPPTLSWNGRPVVPAVTLPLDWTRSVVIPDLSQLIPTMRTQPGIWEIEAQQSFTRFAWTVDMAPVGAVGVVDDNRTWQGAVASENKLRILIIPDLGAKFHIGVFDLSSGGQVPISMRPVYVYSQEEALRVSPELDLAEIWNKANDEIFGYTGMSDGWVVWDQGDPCMPEGEYLAVAKYKEEYAQVPILPYDQENGWQADCEGFIEKKILFGEKPETYSIYGFNSVRIRNKAIVNGGNIGAGVYGEKKSEGEVDVEENVLVHSGVKIIGKTVLLSSTAKVDSIYYNVLEDKGATILGDTCSTLDSCEIPTWEPTFPNGSVINGEDDKVIKSGEREKFDANSKDWDDVILESRAVLELEGGVIYQFNSLSLGSDSQLICLEGGAVEIRIAERLNPGSKVYLGPSPVALPPSTVAGGLHPSDIVIYIAGYDKKKPIAVFGEGNIVRANIYVPLDTLEFGEGCQIEGSFIAKDVVIGQKTVVWLDSHF